MTSSGRTATGRGRLVRRQLLDAAAALIAEVGWTGVSTRMLAERAGLSAGLVHYHFPSIAVLLRTAAVDLIERFAHTAGEALFSSADADQLIDRLLDGLDGAGGESTAAVVISESYLAASRDPELADRLRTVVTGFRERITAWLDDHGHPDPAATASVVTAAVDGLALHRALHPDLAVHTAKAALLRLLGAAGDGAIRAAHVGGRTGTSRRRRPR